MLRVTLAILLALCSVALSEESSPREPENKAEATQGDNQHGGPTKQITVPANSPTPTVINIFGGKHSGEESQCAQPKDWKEWGSFAWCKSWEVLDAEKIIAAFTVILGVATWKLWRATDALVKGAEAAARRQLRAYLVVEAGTLENFEAGKIALANFDIRNVGQTPAHDVIMATGVEIVPRGGIPTFYKPSSDELRAQPNPRSAYFADQIMHTKKDALRPFNQDEIDAVLAPHQSRVSLGGRVYYKDVFGDEWHTDFLYVYSGPETRTMIPDQYWTGNKGT